MRLGLLARDNRSGVGICTGVWGDGHELTGFVGVSHVLDDPSGVISLNLAKNGERISYVGKKSEIE
jgi:hypothetical protein